MMYMVRQVAPHALGDLAKMPEDQLRSGLSVIQTMLTDILATDVTIEQNGNVPV